MAPIDDLIKAITSTQSEESSTAFKRLRSAANRTLKESKAGRTNQFGVHDQYRGLEEKARVFNFAELADALHVAWDHLNQLDHKFSPEFLSLLLHLSDDPVNKTSLDSLEDLERESSPPQLTWNDILKNDPYNEEEEGLWDNVDFAAESSSESDGDELEDEDSAERVSSAESSTYSKTEDISVTINKFKLSPDVQGLEDFQTTRADETRVKASDETLILGEARIIRETIFMLYGLPTEIYQRTNTGEIELSDNLSMQSVSDQALRNLLANLTRLGSTVVQLREWTERKEDIHILQAFQHSVSTRLEQIDQKLGDIQSQMIHEEGNPVTLLTLTRDAHFLFRPLLPLSNLAKSVVENQLDSSFRLLEDLFAMVCTYQGMGDIDSCVFTASIFNDIMQAYARPIRSWMTAGEVGPRESLLFVKESDTTVALHDLWTSQFSLRLRDDSYYQAPQFLHPFIKKIYAAGKSMRFLKVLGRDVPEESGLDVLDLGNILSRESLSELRPVEEKFTSTLDSWISRLHGSSSEQLRRTLTVHCGLWRDLDALEYLFFNKEGILLSEAGAAFLKGIDTGRRGWNNGMLLTGIFRDSFRSTSTVDTHRVLLRIVEDDQLRQTGLRSLSKLACLQLSYTLPWTTSNVIKPDSLSTFRSAFTLLLQVQRGKELLDKQTTRGFEITKQRLRTETQFLISSMGHRLRWYVDTIQAYFGTMLPRTYAKLRKDLADAEDIDAMIKIYDTFIERTEMRTFTGTKYSTTRQAVVSLLELVASFADAAFSTHFEGHDGSAPKRLATMAGSFTRLLSFALSGIRSLSRSEGDEYLGMLADNLSMGIKEEHDA